jgi:NADH-quinone oxidoreductase subunit G
MGIRTESKLVDECRQGVMEFLLINHPLDCPICDQAGECRLQEFSVGFGRGESRFQDEKVHKPKNQDIGARIVLDDERCIMCSRCVRFSSEIAEDDVLGFTERGSHTVLTTHPGKRLDHNYSLNTVDICPVGALTSKDFRFQMRVWFLKETKSICTSCGTGCNTTIGSRENIIHRQTPRENNAVNSAWMCDHGRLNFHYVNDATRLLDPMIKEGSLHRLGKWKESLRLFGEKIKGFRGDQIAIIGSGRMTNEELYLLNKLAGALGTEWVDIVPRHGQGDDFLMSADKNPNTHGAKLLFVDQPGSALSTIKDKIAAGEIKALIAWQEDLIVDADFSADDLAKLEFFLSGHLRTHESSKHAHLVLPTAAFPEKRGSMINVTGRLQRLGQATECPGQARNDWETLRDLIHTVADETKFYLIEDLVRSMTNDIPELSGLTLAKIGPHGLPLIATNEKIPLLAKEAERRARGLIVG